MAEQRSYCEPADYYEFANVTPAIGVDVAVEDKRVRAVIRRASSAVDSMLVTAVYPVDENGYPLDADTTDTLKDATCAQVAWFEDTGDTTGAAAQFQSGTILSVGFTRGYGEGTGNTGQKARLSPEALQILRNAGLVSAGVGHR